MISTPAHSEHCGLYLSTRINLVLVALRILDPEIPVVRAAQSPSGHELELENFILQGQL